jgi:hypothetical protein
MSGDTEILSLMEILLTAEIVNQNQELDINDLTPPLRPLCTVAGNCTIKRPLVVSEGLIKRATGIPDAGKRLKGNPFVHFEEFGQRLSITTLEPAARWFLQQGGNERIVKNPALAYYYEKSGKGSVSYTAVREKNPPFEDTKTFLEGEIAKIIHEDDRLRGALDLMIIRAPEEIEQRMDTLACTGEQKDIITKIHYAVTHREFFRHNKIHEVGKILFVGPSGTGKTSLALAMSHEMHMPIIEVRLSMLTSQYLGETSKNIERIFEFAKKLAPCIIFIDEFDYVATSRVTDDHAAMKRAVNVLLKNIDQTSLISNRIILIGATNHPQLLDSAAWRRFDEVVEFSLPDAKLRLEILEKITGKINCRFDFDDLAARTDGFSGADLRIMIKEALFSAMKEKRRDLAQEDINKGIARVKMRHEIRNRNWSA